MRVTAGAWGGRKLKVPKSQRIRPTTDMVRQALFNIAGPGIAGARVLDLYAGTGALALEALSRGAGSAVLVDCGKEAASLVRENLAMVGAADRAEFISGHVLKVIARLAGRGEQFGFIFADPPYASDEAAALAQHEAVPALLTPQGVCVIEHNPKTPITRIHSDLAVAGARTYGDTALLFLRRRADAPEPSGGRAAPGGSQPSPAP